MKTLTALILCLGLAGPALAFKAFVETYCAGTSTILNALDKEFSEQLIFIGSRSEGRKVGVFYNPQAKTYTVVEMDAEVSCVLTTGTEGVQIDDKPYKPSSVHVPTF